MITLTHVILKTRQVILQDADFTFKKVGFMAFLLSMARERRHCSELLASCFPSVVDISQPLLLCFIMRALNGWMET